MVIYPESFSVKPNTEATVGFRNLFNTTSQTAVNKNLTLLKGNYVFCSKNAEERELHISSSAPADEYSKSEAKNVRKCAIVLENIRNMDIDCSYSNFIMDGVMTHLVIKNCENIKIKNLSIETVNPNVHKISVMKASTFYVTFKIEDADRFSEENGEYFWHGTDYKTSLTELKNASWVPTATPDNLSHLTKTNHPLHGMASIKPVSKDVFNVRFIMPKDFEVGQVFYIYPNMRKEVGILIDSSKNITLDNIKQTSNYGMGLVAQNSDFITLNGLNFVPGAKAAVDFCSVSDFLNFSSCRGKVKVTDSTFDSGGNRGCALSGVNFKIVRSDKNKMTVKFCNPATYGFDCIRNGDMIAFINPKTMQDIASVKVMKATLRDECFYDLELATYDPPIGEGGIVENLSANADFEFSGNTLNRISGGGVAVTTRGRVRIENNKFLNTGKSGIIIADDVTEAFEGGPIRDAVIRGNAFMNCEESAILVKPGIRKYASPIHKNILIENNLFIINNIYAFAVFGAEDIVMKDNVYRGHPLNGNWVVAHNTENIVLDITK